MQFKSSILAILSGAALSAALAVNVRITTEELKQPDRPVAQRPISALGVTLKELKQSNWAIPQHPISPLGVVTPVESCGGTGTPVQLRIQNWEGEPPVSIQPNTDTLVEFEWIPNANFDDGTFKIIAKTSVGDIDLYSSTGSGVGGQLSTLRTSLRISNALSGQDIVMVMQVQDQQGHLLLCLKVAVHVE